jgi:uncharacterized membrane protein YfcA
MNLFIFLFIGLCAGIASGLFGIGGGIIIVPALVLAAGFSQHAATATSLIALLLPVGALGVWKYYEAGKIAPENIYAGLIMAFGIFCGAYFGARISIALDEQLLRRFFAIFLLLVAAKLWFTAK